MRSNRKDALKILAGNEKYFKSGRYNILDSGKKVFYQGTDKNHQFIMKNTMHLKRQDQSFESMLKFKMKQILSKIISFNIQNHLEQCFNGSLIMGTREGDLKIFDFEENIILNILNDVDKYTKIKTNYYKFKFFFNIPRMQFLNKDNVYLEEYIDYIPYISYTEEQKEKGIEYILKSYENYLDEYNWKNIKVLSFSTFIADLEGQLIIPQLIKKIRGIIAKGSKHDLIQIKCHGDINLYNLLLYDDRFYIIDWEDIDFYSITYDFINLIFIEYAFNNNDKYLTNFIKGRYDDYFINMFEKFQLDYNVDENIYYLALFIIEKTNVLKGNSNKVYDKITLNKFLSFLNEAEKLKRMYA